MRDLRRARIRSWLEARLLDSSAVFMHAQYGEQKRAAIGAMSGTVLELGPGTGVNMRYYATGVKVIAIEPNPAMHGPLRDAAQQHGVDLDVRELRGERVDVADGSVDGVVATLVLCGVDNTEQVIREVQRVAKPGAPFFFIEHVRSPTTLGRLVQRAVKPFHRWLFNGCEVDRQTALTLRRAGFETIEIDEVDTGWRGMYCRHQIVGTATCAA